jgi:hypothetical protein
VDADGRILEILDKARDPAGYTLVSSDRLLGERARQRRARCVTSIKFRRTLDETPSSAEEEGPLSAEQIAEWESWFEEQS